MMMRGPMPGPTKPIGKATLRRIAATFVPYRPQVILTGIAVILSAGLGLLSPFFLQTLVNDGLMGRNLSVVTRFMLYTLAATLAATGFSIAYGYMSTVIGQRIMRDLRNQLYEHLQ